MIWLPILFVCLSSCDFMVGDGMWSQSDCEKTVASAIKELEDAGATVVGVCIQVKVT
jgi:hypothetical protein